jgi:hypothetical protein
MIDENVIKQNMGVRIGTGSTALTGMHDGGLNEKYMNATSFGKWLMGDTEKGKAKTEQKAADAEFDRGLAQLIQQMAAESAGTKAKGGNNTVAFMVGGILVAASFVAVAIFLYKKKKATE